MATETAAEQSAASERVGVQAPWPAAEPDRPAPRRLRRRALRWLLVPLVLSAIGMAAWWGYERLIAVREPVGLTASGIVEADEVSLSPEVTARLTSLPRTGDLVRAGDVVARLDESLVQMQIRQADPAQRLQLEIEAAKHTIRSPLNGTITRVPLKVGETVVPGQTIVVVSNPRQVEVNLYVHQADLGQVFLGQAVRITADPYPDRAFEGTVTWISPRAEFTPRNVQTRQDRQNLVFAVEVRIANPDEALRPGLPVDATFASGRPAR